MNKFSKRSLKNLSTCHESLQAIAHELIQEMDIAVIWGHRSKEDQELAVAGGFSDKKWPESKHNKLPSMAMDITPYPIDWDDLDRFNKMCDAVERIAEKLGVDIRLGRSWGDYPHVELL